MRRRATFYIAGSAGSVRAGAGKASVSTAFIRTPQSLKIPLGSRYWTAIERASLCHSESFHSQLASGISILQIFYMPGNAAGSHAASPFRGFNPQNLAQLKVHERFCLSRHLKSNLPADLIDGRSPVLCLNRWETAAVRSAKEFAWLNDLPAKWCPGCAFTAEANSAVGSAPFHRATICANGSKFSSVNFGEG